MCSVFSPRLPSRFRKAACVFRVLSLVRAARSPQGDAPVPTGKALPTHPDAGTDPTPAEGFKPQIQPAFQCLEPLSSGEVITGWSRGRRRQNYDPPQQLQEANLLPSTPPGTHRSSTAIQLQTSATRPRCPQSKAPAGPHSAHPPRRRQHRCRGCFRAAKPLTSGDIPAPPGQGPVQPAVGDPASAGGLEWMTHRGPFQPLLFCDHLHPGFARPQQPRSEGRGRLSHQALPPSRRSHAGVLLTKQLPGGTFHPLSFISLPRLRAGSPSREVPAC